MTSQEEMPQIGTKMAYNSTSLSNIEFLMSKKNIHLDKEFMDKMLAKIYE